MGLIDMAVAVTLVGLSAFAIRIGKARIKAMSTEAAIKHRCDAIRRMASVEREDW